MQHLSSMPDVIVAHALPLLAAGLANALAPRVQLLSNPARSSLPEDREHAVLVTDLRLALEVLSQDRPQPGRPWRPWRCVVVSLDTACCPVRHAMQQGVLGFLQASCSMDELDRAVAAARCGHRFLCSTTAARMAEAAVDEPLTPRENEVLLLLCQGLDNKSIALRLSMALGTVKTHVKAILEKLGATSRTQAVAAAHRRGMSGLEAAHPHPSGIGARPSSSGISSSGSRLPLRQPSSAATPHRGSLHEARAVVPSTVSASAPGPALESVR